jgi:hypothetical protein
VATLLLAVLVAREAVSVVGAALGPSFTGAACDCGSDAPPPPKKAAGAGPALAPQGHHPKPSAASTFPWTSRGARWLRAAWSPTAALVAAARQQLLTPAGALELPPPARSPAGGGAFTESGGPTRKPAPAGGGPTAAAIAAEAAAEAAMAEGDGTGSSNVVASPLLVAKGRSDGGVDLEAGRGGGSIAYATPNKQERAPTAYVDDDALPWAVDLDALQTAYEEEQALAAAVCAQTAKLLAEAAGTAPFASAAAALPAKAKAA